MTTLVECLADSLAVYECLNWHWCELYQCTFRLCLILLFCILNVSFWPLNCMDVTLCNSCWISIIIIYNYVIMCRKWIGFWCVHCGWRLPQMLLNLHKKSWIDGLKLDEYQTHCCGNETVIKDLLELAKNYNKVNPATYHMQTWAHTNSCSVPTPTQPAIPLESVSEY